MSEKIFNCKKEDVPVVAGFVLESMENDKADFQDNSPVFSDTFIDDAKTKQKECLEMVKSEDVLKLQKKITEEIKLNLKGLRTKLNITEGYLKLSEKELDINVVDFNLSIIRSDIGKINVEGVVKEVQSLIIKLKRNETPLQAKGMKATLITDLITFNDEILKLNQNQNAFKNKRSRVASENIKEFNQLWDILNMILDAARSMYRIENKVKLKEYTIANLLKRVHNEGGKNNDNTEPTEPEKPV